MGPSVVYQYWRQFLVFLKPIAEVLRVLFYSEAKRKLAGVLAHWPGWAWNHAGFLGSAGTCPQLQTWMCHTWILERNPCQVLFPPENCSTHPTKSYFSLEVPEASITEAQGNYTLKMVWPSLCSWLAVGTFHPLASASPIFRAMQLPGAPVTPRHPKFALSPITPRRQGNQTSVWTFKGMSWVSVQGASCHFWQTYPWLLTSTSPAPYVPFISQVPPHPTVGFVKCLLCSQISAAMLI